MKKRLKRKVERKKEAMFCVKVNIAEELKQDSIAQKIKSYFEPQTITNMMLFKYNEETKKVSVSKRQLIYLLSLCNDIEQLKEYDFEIVENINPTEV